MKSVTLPGTVVLLCLASACEDGCSHGDVMDVMIEMAPSGRMPVFSFDLRGRPATSIREIRIEKVPGGLICRLASEPGSSHRWPGRWTYGDALGGYQVEGCPELSPGRYLIDVRAPAALAGVKFCMGKEGVVDCAKPER
jgi:hypothetical protein